MKKELKELKVLLLATLLGVSTMGCNKGVNTNETPKSIESTIDYTKEMEQLLSKHGVKLEPLGFNTKYYKIIKSNSEVLKEYTGISIPDYDIKLGLDEFSELLIENNLSYETIIDAINSNQNIDEEKKNILKSSLDTTAYDNIYKSTIMKYNLANFTIEDVYEDEEYYSKFESTECCIYINLKYANTEELYKNALLLAAYGSSKTEAYIDFEGKKIYCSPNEYCLDAENKRIFELGKTVEFERQYQSLSFNTENVVDTESKGELYISRVVRDFCMFAIGSDENQYTRFLDYISTTNYNEMIPALIELDVSDNKDSKIQAVSKIMKVFINNLYAREFPESIKRVCDDIVSLDHDNTSNITKYSSFLTEKASEYIAELSNKKYSYFNKR